MRQPFVKLVGCVLVIASAGLCTKLSQAQLNHDSVTTEASPYYQQKNTSKNSSESTINNPSASTSSASESAPPALPKSNKSSTLSNHSSAGANANPNSSKLIVTNQPNWDELNPLQKLALQPLAEHWSSIDDAQKRKWLAISDNFQNRSLEEQDKLHARMADWVSLSSQQRTQARIGFTQTQKLSNQDKKNQWEAYQALSSEEKKQLADKGRVKLSGAALVIKPVTTPKQTLMPKAASPTWHIRIETDPEKIDPRTLLPIQKNKGSALR